MTAWNLRPIASALWRNRTGALLVAFQIAIGLAVLVNAVYVVKQRVDKISRPTGMDMENMIVRRERRLRQGLRLRRELAGGPRHDSRPARSQGGEPLQQHPTLGWWQLERLPGRARRDEPGNRVRGQQRSTSTSRAWRRSASRFPRAARSRRTKSCPRFGNLRIGTAGDRHQGARQGDVSEGSRTRSARRSTTASASR